jgi:hypothetical protein
MEEWASQHQGMAVLIAALVSSVVGGICTWWLTRNSQSKVMGSQAATVDLLKGQLRQANQERASVEAKHTRLTEKLEHSEAELTGKLGTCEKHLADAKKIVRKYESVRAKLENSHVVRTYRQPVVLVGPKDVGKTSLLLQWHAPWDTTESIPHTQAHRSQEVPIHDLLEPLTEPHFADPDLLVEVESHLVLKVHDFPGELNGQKSIREVVIEETRSLRRQTRRSLGVVLILMFDAEEAHTGIKDKTQEYYNGDLFKGLRELVSTGQANLERLILVFNKYDKLRQHFPAEIGDQELLNLCIERFTPIFKLLRGACSPQKVCEVLTVLSREEMRFKNRGAPIVLGEAARAFVEAFTDGAAVKQIFGSPASTRAAEKFF